MKRNSLFFLMFWSFFNLFGIANLEFVRLNSNNGLSSEEVRNIFQDNDGYLWFLTSEGLNRYDGYNFKVFKPGQEELDFSSSAFESICEDKQNRLWLGTPEMGVLIFDKNNNSVLQFEDLSNGQKLSDLHIRTLLADRENNIWIGTEYGLYRFNIGTKELTYFNLGDDGATEPAWCIVESMIEDSKGNIWIGTWSSGLFVFNPKKNAFTNHNIFNKGETTINDNRIKSLFEDAYQNIWVGTWEDGLYQIKLHNEQINIERYFLYDINNEQSISGDIIYSIAQDVNNNLWIGTPYGLCIIEDIYSRKPYFNNVSHEFGSSKGLSNNEVWKIYKDKSGLMWVGTLEGGLNKVHPNGKIFEGYTIPPVDKQIYSQTIQSFCIDADGDFLVGVKSLGFGRYNLESKSYTPYINMDKYSSLPENINTVNCFLNENDKYLWLGTRYTGLIVYDVEHRKHIVVNSLNESFSYENVNVIFQDQAKDTWVGTENGLYKITRCNSDEECYEVNPVEEFSNKRVVSISQDRLTNLWIGTSENGIFQIQQEEDNTAILNNFSRKSNNSPTSRIQFIYTDSQNNIWAGTSDKGLLIYNKASSSFSIADITKGLESDMVFGITEDANGNLWFTTNNGLVRLIQQDDDLIGDSYTITDGIQGNIFIRGAIFKQNNNRIFIGGYHGFNAFYPTDLKPNSFLPPTAITELTINDRPKHFNVLNPVPIALSYNENDIKIRFSANSFYKPEKNSFAYKLEGFSEEWQYVDANNRVAHFPNLSAGEYTFYVKSSNSSDLWNQEPVKIEFKIIPAPYKTWWAFTIYGLVFILLLRYIYQSIIKNEKVKRELEIEKIEHAKTENVNQFKLRFFTNISHEILTPLSIISCSFDLIKNRTRKNKEEFKIVDRNILQLNRLLHQLLDFRKIESGHLKLQVKQENFNAFVKQTVENFYPLGSRKNITLNLRQDENSTLIWFDYDKLDKILDNLISNALKYTNEGGSVLVSSKRVTIDEQKFAEVSVSDTGKGIQKEDLESIFNRFYRSESETENTGTGIGLAFTKSLVELHNGRIEVRSEPGKGSVFTVIIPADKQSYSSSDVSLLSQESQIIQRNQGINFQNQEGDHVAFSGFQGGKLKLLLVDDNDDFRNILGAHFRNNFNLLEANNGQTAIQMAKKDLPDIIVSDIMMPIKDGYELCVELKKNIDTQHIPIILLTAMTGEDARSRGYVTGADSYINKPISLPVLESRINALLLKNKDLIKSDNPDILFGSKSTKIPDPLFLKELEKHIQDKISDSDLSIKDIARQLCMSESMFYRTLKRLTNVTPVEYVKTMRLNSAAEILKKENTNISEVAYATGFSDQSYFAACFKKQFGKTPSNYIAFNRNN